MPDVIMPKMGDAMTEGKVLRWIKQSGEAVKKGDPIAEIETDKVNVEIEAEWDGTLSQILVDAGQVAAVGAPIAFIAQPGEQAADRGDRKMTAEPAAPAAAAQTAPARRTAPAAVEPTPQAGPGTDWIRATPVARKLAEQHGIPLASIRGSGPQGRITKEDVEALIATQEGAPAPPGVAAPSPGAAAPAVGPAAPQAPAAREVPLTRIRATIARRMTESKQRAPHFYVTVGIAMDAALELRRQLNERLPEHRKVTVNDMVVRAAALALVNFP
ncbi:MAG: 2-oxo acid dehydrogenase subunit E2, partial [Armatimonadetes bacterium]|nr:2-oxo acid dehydrogenase subunit E2 [Armatimonadota bacterium]